MLLLSEQAKKKPARQNWSKRDARESLARRYSLVLRTESDIYRHCRLLRFLASRCQHATEFGVRWGNSTIALLAGSLGQGKLQRLVSYDQRDKGAGRKLSAAFSGLFEFREAYTHQMPPIAPTELLLIDTWHNYDTLSAELSHHHFQVSKWILLHDTELHGMRGQAPHPHFPEQADSPYNNRGLKPAVVDFLKQQPSWSLAAHYTRCNGLTVLTRLRKGRRGRQRARQARRDFYRSLREGER